MGCDCDRFVEVWNLVFSQFNNDGHGNYTDLVQKNIDTGMGLERLAFVMQNVDNLFLVDTVQNIMKKICQIAGVNYGDDPKTDVSLRVITDHIRSTVFMIGDGVLPSNEGRGYVLRRLLRRASLHGKLLGIQGAFLKDVVDTVIQENEKAYPELKEKRETIQKIVSFEEESFQKTIDQGMALLNDLIDKADSKVFSGDNAFTLNDTYGFPLDFDQGDPLRAGHAGGRGAVPPADAGAAGARPQRPQGRRRRRLEGRGQRRRGPAGDGVHRLHPDAGRRQGAGHHPERPAGGFRRRGAEVSVVLDTTPFYGEGGGQVGDTGVLEAEGVSVDVVDTTKHEGVYLHRAVVSEGTLNVGDTLTAKVTSTAAPPSCATTPRPTCSRRLCGRCWAATWSRPAKLVNERHVRFDFTHFSALTPEELLQVENLVNQENLEGRAGLRAGDGH